MYSCIDLVVPLERRCMPAGAMQEMQSVETEVHVMFSRSGDGPVESDAAAYLLAGS